MGKGWDYRDPEYRKLKKFFDDEDTLALMDVVDDWQHVAYCHGNMPLAAALGAASDRIWSKELEKFLIKPSVKACPPQS
jgi:hypothetical protein